MSKIDLFGNHVADKNSLKDLFGACPFSTLDAKSSDWQRRKRMWLNLGIKSEIGRDAKTYHMKDWANNANKNAATDTSVFDPVLCELMYRWFCPDGGHILDPFAGGSVRGIVAHYIGYKYTGIDIREEQIESNKEQARRILSDNNQPTYHVGDSNKVLDNLSCLFDMVFSCPPYGNLEVYSDLDGDISNMEYDKFVESYQSIIKKSCQLLKKNGHAVFVVGEFRDKKGFYQGFVHDTYTAFQKAGMKLYNEGVLLTPIGTAMLRAVGNMKAKKLVKTHQNILDFVKI